MLYKKTEIIEDKDFFEGIENFAELSRLSGVSESYISLLKEGKRIASEEVYMRLFKAKLIMLNIS